MASEEQREGSAGAAAAAAVGVDESIGGASDDATPLTYDDVDGGGGGGYYNSDEEAEYANDDEPEVEGESPANVQPQREPSYKNVNTVPFIMICKRMELLSQVGDPKKRKKVAPTKNEKIQTLLPPKLLQFVLAKDKNGLPGSIFPLYRLLMAEKDASRRFSLKEKLLAKMYCEAYGLKKPNPDFNKLLNFSDPHYVTDGGVGDFSLVMEKVLQGRETYQGSKLTIGGINKLLDELAATAHKAKNSSHDWREGDGSAPKKATAQSLRAAWVQKLRDNHVSALEHKWLARIILRNLKIGVGSQQMLAYFHSLAPALWTAHNSLKGVCDKLCSAESAEIRLMSEQQNPGSQEEDKGVLASYMPIFRVPVKFGVPFSPMRSERTGFQKILSDVSKPHRAFINSGDGKELNLGWSLAIKHPAFCVETKLDGERLLVHIHRSGTVKIHSRHGNWYSDLYSPVLGPAIRKAVEKNGSVDIILDGEILAWDNKREETIPFGNNRTVAKLRHGYLKARGECDARDEGIHAGETDHKSMNASNAWDDKASRSQEQDGAECWLQFVAFDVVYIDGPGAASILKKSVSPHVTPQPGSLIDLDGFERKKLLYRILDEQKNLVAVVPTQVVRPNGTTIEASAYFAPESPLKEAGYPAYVLDSIDCTYNGVVPGLERIDMERRLGLSDQHISQSRANAVDEIYRQTVETERLEGLLFKDLSAPYVLGELSKSLRYWHKFKPDYFNGSSASDLDLVIIGAYYAHSLRLAGKPSSFLVACVDPDDTDRFIPACKVNAAALGAVLYKKFLEDTGYKSEDGVLELGKWFREEEKTLPLFVSERSYPVNWRVADMDYPDLWIRPDDSFVTVVNAGEIVHSDAFPLGLTLRFPRITRLRKDADAKDPSECESSARIWEIYKNIKAEREGSSVVASTSVPGLPSGASKYKACRFLTEDQLSTEQSKKRSLGRKQTRAVEMVQRPSDLSSKALCGLYFAVLDGAAHSYTLGEKGIDLDEAKEQGWERDASLVKGCDDIKTFILRHGGKVKISPGEDMFVLGGKASDPRVTNHIRAITNALAATKAHTKRDGTAKVATKKSQQYKKMAQQQGVLRWAFVYSLVRRWISTEENKTKAIKEHNPTMLEPTVFDYLATAGNAPPRFSELSNSTMLQRAMDIVQSSKRKAEESRGASSRPLKTRKWQAIALQELEANERWVMSCQHQPLWPYRSKTDASETTQLVILYPDMFGDDFGCTRRSKSEAMDDKASGVRRKTNSASSAAPYQIASSLPLASIMGALVTPNLHEGVTHVLCELQDGTSHVKWQAGMGSDCFRDPEHGRRLLNRLEKVNDGVQSVSLVSADWVRNTWKERQQ